MREVGPITPLEALKFFGCMRLGARAWDLRKAGHNIESKPFKVPGGKVVAQYSLVKPDLHGEANL